MDKISLNGTWILRDSEDQEFPVQIPGSVVSGLMDAGKLEDPYFRDNEDKIQDLFRKNYCFERTFRVDGTVCGSGKVTLHCEGIDTLAEIVINGVSVGRTENMFRKYTFDVENILHTGENQIQVRIDSPVNFVEMAKKKGALRGKEYIRKAQCMFGWDWGLTLPDLGIWKDIYLICGAENEIKNVRITQNHKDRAVELYIETELLREREDNTQIAVSLFDNQGVCVANAESKSLETRFTVENPEYWYPRGYGEQPLYHLQVILMQDGTEADRLEKRSDYGQSC